MFKWLPCFALLRRKSGALAFINLLVPFADMWDIKLSHYCRMLLTRHYDQRPFDETVCDAIIANAAL